MKILQLSLWHCLKVWAVCLEKDMDEVSKNGVSVTHIATF
jgi:hypothetical protein